MAELILPIFSENLGCTVDWLAEQYIIKINSPRRKCFEWLYALGGERQAAGKPFQQRLSETEQGHPPRKEIALGWYSLDERKSSNQKYYWLATTNGWEKVLSCQ